jgi:Ni/Fe-hydrogenase 1 B-type cytochrome subunit
VTTTAGPSPPAGDTPPAETTAAGTPGGRGARAAPASRDEIVQVKVWDFPLRMIHWTLVASIAVLAVTGFYIADPIFGSSSTAGFTMGIVITVHITTGWIFTTALLARIYWAFAGNRWAHWDQLLPFSRERRAKLRPSIEYYLFRRLEAPPVVGHNPLAGATYVVLYGMLMLQAITGFALEALANPHGLMWDLTGWVYSVLPIPYIRLLHDLVMWLTFGFVIHHVYSAWLVDKEERSGEISSIITGWKSLPRSRVDAETTGAARPRIQHIRLRRRTAAREGRIPRGNP